MLDNLGVRVIMTAAFNILGLKKVDFICNVNIYLSH